MEESIEITVKKSSFSTRHLTYFDPVKGRIDSNIFGVLPHQTLQDQLSSHQGLRL